MSNREPLRDFQRRLAERLQAASDESAKATWLAVEAGEGSYLFPLAEAGEIFPSDSFHPVPYTQPWCLGVASLRGGLYVVADLASLIRAQGDGLPASCPSAVTHSQWVTLNPLLDLPCALRVDRVVGLRGTEDFAGSAAAPDTAPCWFGSTFHDQSGTSWQALDLQGLSRQPDFLRIGT